MSTMVIPAGHEGPLHTHHDVEEVFFVLTGQMTCFMEKDGEKVERTLGPRDAISVPAGVSRGERNDGDEDALMIVIVGAKKCRDGIQPYIFRPWHVGNRGNAFEQEHAEMLGEIAKAKVSLKASRHE